MSALFLACLPFTLLPANDGQPLHVTPGDPGGATCDGITLTTFREYCGNPNLTAADLGRITPVMVQAIYATKFWNPIRGDDMPVGVAGMAFDHGVLCGPVPSARVLQTAIGFTGDDVDGYVGQETIDRLKTIDPGKLINGLVSAQIAYYKRCSDWAEFGHGWTLRVQRRQAFMLHLQGVAPAPVVVATSKVPSPHNTSTPLRLVVSNPTPPAPQPPKETADDLNQLQLDAHEAA